jgi:hypothetical protein
LKKGVMILILGILLSTSTAFAVAIPPVTIPLAWNNPTTNTNGTALTDLAGTKVYSGPVSRGTSTSVSVYTYTPVTLGIVTSYNLVSSISGTLCMAVTAFNTSAISSDPSNEKCVWLSPNTPNAPSNLNAPTGVGYV